MVFGTILSGCLFILPAAVTTGVLVGLDAVRQSNNQQPIFTVPPGGGLGGGPGMGPTRGNAIETDLYCDETVGVYPYVGNGYQQFTREFLAQFLHPCSSGSVGLLGLLSPP
jgi:hypothetical protein